MLRSLLFELLLNSALLLCLLHVFFTSHSSCRSAMHALAVMLVARLPNLHCLPLHVEQL
jgi:hypothetical protein